MLSQLGAIAVAAALALLWRVSWHVSWLRAYRRWRRGGSTARERKLHGSRRTKQLSGLPPMQVVLDCSFVSTMSDKELRSLALQAQTLYAVVRRCRVPALLTLNSCDLSEDAEGSRAERVFRAALVQQAPLTWDRTFVRFAADDFDAERCAERGGAAAPVVYLSPDGDEVLERVDAGTTYVFGGIVDRSHSSNMSAKRASALAGVRSARLPLRKLGGFPTDRPCVLNIDTAVRIVLGVHAAMQGRSGSSASDAAWRGVWRSTIRKCVPQRMLKETRTVSEGTALPQSRAALAALTNAQLRQLNLKGRLINLAPIGSFRFDRSEFGRGEARWTSRVVRVADGAELGVGTGRTGKSADSVAAWESLRQLDARASSAVRV